MNYSIGFPNLNIFFEHVGKSFTVFGYSIAFYGVVIAIGMIAGVTFITKEAKRCGYKEDDFFDICIWTIVMGIIGARFYYVAFSWDLYKGDIKSILNIRQGGLGIYGGIIFGIITVIILCKIKKIKALRAFDICFFGVIIGQIAGRWGNFFNREAFGGYSDGLLAMALPTSAVRSYSDITTEMVDHLLTINGVDYVTVHPTFLYESLWNLMILVIMLIVSRHKKFDGQVAFIYLGGYGIGRFWIESLRTDQLLLWNTRIPVSMVVATIMVVIAVVGSVISYRKTKPTRDFEKKLNAIKNGGASEED